MVKKFNSTRMQDFQQHQPSTPKTEARAVNWVCKVGTSKRTTYDCTSIHTSHIYFKLWSTDTPKWSRIGTRYFLRTRTLRVLLLAYPTIPKIFQNFFCYYFFFLLDITQKLIKVVKVVETLILSVTIWMYTSFITFLDLDL